MPVSIKAPREHGGLVIHPPAEQIPGLYERNRSRFRSYSLDILGQSLTDLRHSARQETLQLTHQYLHEADEPVADWQGDGLLLAGHQPELFHPGVWIKNFALQHYAEKFNAIPVNLVVDNDLAKPAKIAVPLGKRMTTVAFDDGEEDAAYEETPVHDEGLFASFPARVGDISKDWPFQPLLDDFWQKMNAHPTANRGERLVRGRRALERAWGYRSLEVPLSKVCQTRAFARFALFLIENADRFAECYNRAVIDYRKANGIRSKNHPVPELTRQKDWLEMPFWAWCSRDRRRQHLFARKTPGGCELRAGSQCFVAVEGNLESRLEQWLGFEQQGIKIRTRALSTTLFCRLFLGDLFIHGIGGGKYDEVTDDIIRRFFDVDPPGFAILSATQLLPLPRFDHAQEELQKLERLRRDLQYNPQRHLQEPAGLLAQKKSLMAREGETHRQRADRFFELRHLNEQLLPFVADQIASVNQKRAAAEESLRLNQVHSSREFSFCLFPEDLLRDFFRSRFPLLK